MVDLLKTFLSREVEKRIDEYLHKMKTTKFLSELNLDLNSNYISLKSYSINDLEHLKSIWLEVANLSAYLYVEYEFFRQFSFPNRYESQIYEDSLKKLGYKQHKGIWKIDQIPNKQCIIENIFYSYFYMFLCQEKKIELDNEKFMNENAENSIKLENLCNPSRNVNNTIDEEIPLENIDHVLPIIGEMRKSNDLCSYCDSKIINGNCQICGGKSNCLETILQKINKVEYRPVQMRTNSSKTSSKNINSSQWICNVCSYNKNNISNINCEVCMSSKFAKINLCVLESSSDASNEHETASVEDIENIFIKHNANNADNKDKWTCTKCTFINKISVDLCEICLSSNINKMDDFELPEETWCCKRCGENNSFECYKCKNCRVPAEFFNKWRCEQCSYYNDKIAIRCGVCEIGNPYLMKCNICSKNFINIKYDKICKKCTILGERWTNRETIDCQDNRKIYSRFGGGSNYEKTDNLSIYKVDKTQSERSGSNKSLFKGDRNSGKLIETRLISNEDNQQKPENIKEVPAVVKAMNKKNSKPCKNCKSKVCINNQYWCTKCEYSQWYCQNEACDVINFRNEYCKQCTAKKGSDFSACNNFWVMKDGKEVQMWQCGFCLQFIAGTSKKCNKCKNFRDLPNYVKCKCNWNNLIIKGKCDKCNADLIKL